MAKNKESFLYKILSGPIGAIGIIFITIAIFYGFYTFLLDIFLYGNLVYMLIVSGLTFGGGSLFISYIEAKANKEKFNIGKKEIKEAVNMIWGSWVFFIVIRLIMHYGIV